MSVRKLLSLRVARHRARAADRLQGCGIMGQGRLDRSALRRRQFLVDQGNQDLLCQGNTIPVHRHSVGSITFCAPGS